MKEGQFSPPAKAALSVGLQQLHGCECCVPGLPAEGRQVPGEVSRPGRHEGHGVGHHAAAAGLLRHPDRARVFLAELGHGLRGDHVRAGGGHETQHLQQGELQCSVKTI